MQPLDKLPVEEMPQRFEKPPVLIKQEFPLPTDHKGIVELIADILKKGMIQRIILAVGKPVVVERMVREYEEGTEPVLGTEGETLLKRAMESEMRDLPLPEDELNPFEKLFLAFSMLKTAKPAAIFSNSPVGLRDWLGLDGGFPLNGVFGVPVRFDKDVPSRSVLLVGVDESDNVELSVRIAL